MSLESLWAKEVGTQVQRGSIMKTPGEDSVYQLRRQAPRSQHSDLQDCEKIDSPYVRHRIYCTLLRQLWQTVTH